MSARPIRIQLSRSKGFDLQAISMTANGLPAVNVARPFKHGNPFTIAFCQAWFDVSPVAARAKAVELFKEWRAGSLDKTWTSKEPPPVGDLRGKNLACWCPPGSPC